MKSISNRTLRVAVEAIYPQDTELRTKGLDQIDQIDQEETPPLKFVRHAADSLVWAYGEQLVASFNQYSALAQAVVVTVCFAFAPAQAGLYALGAVLIALAFRDAFTHQKQLQPETKYYLDSAVDAAVAGVFMIAAQGLAVVALPKMALPSQVMYRGLLVAMPLLATLRLVLRPRPEPPGPGNESIASELSAKKIYRRTRWLNFLWLITVYGVVIQNVSDKPGYFPDFLRGFLPMMCFKAWILTRVDDLCRRDVLVTLFSSVKAKTLRRMRGKVAAGPMQDQKDVNYSTFRFFYVTLFGVIALTLYTAIEPFLFGEPLMQSIWHAIGAVLAFMVCVLTWKRVQAANRAAARALLLEAQREEEKVS